MYGQEVWNILWKWCGCWTYELTGTVFVCTRSIQIQSNLNVQLKRKSPAWDTKGILTPHPSWSSHKQLVGVVGRRVIFILGLSTGRQSLPCRYPYTIVTMGHTILNGIFKKKTSLGEMYDGSTLEKQKGWTDCFQDTLYTSVKFQRIMIKWMNNVLETS